MHPLAWVTGAGTGIGKETARALAAQGFRVAVSGRRREPLEALAAENPLIDAYPLDVTDAEAVAETARMIEAEHGPIDMAIFGAGNYHAVSADQINPAEFKSMMDVNYMGVINGLAAVLPNMRAHKKGHVAWIASVAGYRGLPKAAAYGPTKAALINLAESLKPELARDHIAVSIINPGFVKTPLTAQNDFPMPFLMEPEEAGRLTAQGLIRRKFEIAYPWPFVMMMKLARIMPYAWYFRFINRQVMR
jgi:NADP-dependent 3-hydroxy acid dehydrogenase YdfG